MDFAKMALLKSHAVIYLPIDAAIYDDDTFVCNSLLLVHVSLQAQRVLHFSSASYFYNEPVADCGGGGGMFRNCIKSRPAFVCLCACVCPCHASGIQSTCAYEYGYRIRAHNI